jgi:hypothetical protein
MPVGLNKNAFTKSTNLKSKVITAYKKNAIKKSVFEIECEKAFTIEESRKHIHEKIDGLRKN